MILHAPLLLILAGLAFVVVEMLLTFQVARRLGNFGIVDIVWSAGFTPLILVYLLGVTSGAEVRNEPLQLVFMFFAIEAAIMALALQLCFGLPLGVGYLLCAGAVILLFNTAAILAMLRHYREDRDFMYGLDIKFLDEAKGR